MTHGSHGVPDVYPSGSGPEPRGDPPFCHQTRDCVAGVAETVTDPVIVPMILDLDGSSSIQQLNGNVRVHQIQIERIWFTLPVGATRPTNGTLYLTFDNLPISSSYAHAATSYGVDALSPVLAKYSGDSGGQASRGMLSTALAIFSIGRAVPGEQAEVPREEH